MKFEIHNSSGPLLERAVPALAREEAFNGLLLGFLLSGAPTYDEKYFMMVSENDAVELVAMRTPPFNLAFSATGSRSEAALGVLRESLMKLGHELPGVTGPDELARAFAEDWGDCHDKPVEREMAQRIYEIRSVDRPTGVPGQMRPARPGEADLLTEWFLGFHRDTGVILGTEDVAVRVRREIANGMLFVWDHGGPCSMALGARETPRGITIGAVFTPECRRRNGYAGALVADLSQLHLDRGKEFCCLYTDLANPTSNKIYQNVGYRPVGDSGMYRFV